MPSMSLSLSSQSSPEPGLRSSSANSPATFSPEDELDELMRTPVLGSTSMDDEEDPSEGLSSLDTDNTSNLTPLSASPIPSAHRLEDNTSLVQSHRNEVVRAWRLGERLKLQPYQRTMLEAFVDKPTSTRQLLIYAQGFALERKLDAIITASGPFSVTKPLMDNIKSYVMAVLLSPKLSSYKGNIPRDIVIDVIKHYRLNVPENMDHDRHIAKVIKEAVTHEMSQARSKIKKAIHASKKKGAVQSIYELASSLIENTQCTVTVPLCSRLAALRKLHCENPGGKYWDHVDARLEMLRCKGKGNAVRITRVFAGWLAADRKKYAADTIYSISDGSTNEWQTTVDTIINKSSTANGSSASTGNSSEEEEDELIED